MHTEVATSVPEMGRRRCERKWVGQRQSLSPHGSPQEPPRREQASSATRRAPTVRDLPVEGGCHERGRWVGALIENERLSLALAGEGREGVKYSVPRKRFGASWESASSRQTISFSREKPT